MACFGVLQVEIFQKGIKCLRVTVAKEITRTQKLQEFLYKNSETPRTHFIYFQMKYTTESDDLVIMLSAVH
jgi:hypothetical protein